MRCRSRIALFRLPRARARIVLLPILFVALTHVSTVLGQQPPAPGAVYHPPIIALAAPANGTSIPADKPVIVLRFAPGEPSDAIDPSSLRLSVDGEDRTAVLQVASGEAWGELARDTTAARAPSVAAGGVTLIAPGVHLVHVRVCSMRGICATLDSPVTVAPPDVTPPPNRALSPADSSAQRHAQPSMLRKVLDLVITATRKLLAP